MKKIVKTILIAVALLCGLGGIGCMIPPSNDQDPPWITESVKQWTEKIGEQYNCEVGIDWTETPQDSSVIIINIEHTNVSPLEEYVNDSIELITEKLALSYLDEAKPEDIPSYLELKYVNTMEPVHRQTNIPAAKRYFFDVQKRKVIPNIQRLIVFGFEYRQIDTDSEGLWLQRLGGYFSKYYYYNDLKKDRGFVKINENSFKGLDHCEEWETKDPQKIWMANGSIELTQRYIFHHDQEISAVLTYKIYPENEKLRYKDVVRKLTNTARSPKDRYKETYSMDISRNYLSTNYLNYEIKKFGVKVKATADTTSVPWTIRYETAIDDLNFYSDIDYIYEE
jgi:hypothetical protein